MSSDSSNLTTVYGMALRTHAAKEIETAKQATVQLAALARILMPAAAPTLMKAMSAVWTATIRTLQSLTSFSASTRSVFGPWGLRNCGLKVMLRRSLSRRDAMADFLKPRTSTQISSLVFLPLIERDPYRLIARSTVLETLILADIDSVKRMNLPTTAGEAARLAP